MTFTVSACINLSKPFGIPLKVHWSFWVFILGMAWYLQKPDVLFPGDFGMSLLFMVCFMACAYFTTLFYCFMAHCFGFGAREIRLNIGASVTWKEKFSRPRHWILIPLAGPLASFVLAGFLFAGHCLVLGVSGDAWERGLFFYLMTWNLALGIMSLLPIIPASGGYILYGLLALKLSDLRAFHIAVRIGQNVALGAIVWAIFRPFFGYEIVLGLSGLWMLLISQSSLDGKRAELSRGE